MLTYFRCVGGHIERAGEFTPENLRGAPEGTLHPFHFHPLAIEDTLAELHHPKLDDYDTYIYLIVHGMRFDAPTDQFITRELDVFLGPNYLVTHHNGPMRSISSENLYRIVASSSSYHDMVQSTMEAYLSAVSNRLNETMKRLTVIGAIMAALTVITGVYGMNFEFMPELHWRLGYLFVWLIMIVVTGGLWWVFRKKQWI